MQKHPLVSIHLSLGRYRHFIEEILALTEQEVCSEYICVANAHMLVETYNNEEFRKVVDQSVITTPDGIPLTWGLKLLHGIRQDRVAGMDLLPDLLSAVSKQHKSVFFYGGTIGMLNKVKQHISAHYPGIPYTGVYSPPFRPLTSMEEEEVIDIINENHPQILFVVLGCPKQEKWMASMRGRVHSVMIGIGAALPVLIGEQKRAPKWMQDMGLEWFFRFLQEPVRLWKRYLITNLAFIFLILREKLQQVIKNK
jgi:N-acetylglucosaminyldiphosphoundecaprenol N-acetyl-beta-D-mannosaminyltransferase